MAQIIRKYKNGDIVSNKYGKLYKDGIEIEVDDNLLNRISSVSPSAANALRKGNTINLEKLNGEVLISGISDDDVSELKEGQKRRLGRRQGIFEGRAMRSERKGYDNLYDLVYPTSKEPVKNSDSEKSVIDLATPYTLSYNKNEDGTYSLDDSIENLNAKKRLEIYKAGLDESKYNYQYYKKLNRANVANNYIKSIMSKLDDKFYQRLNSNTLTDNDLSILNTIAINANSNKQNDLKEKTDNEKIRILNDTLSGYGVNINDPFVREMSLSLNDDGSFSINGVNPFKNYKRLYINDIFLDTNAQYSPFKGWIWYDGKLYSKENLADPNYYMYNNLRRWREANKANNFGTNDIIIAPDGWQDPFTTYDSSKYFIPGLRETGNHIRYRALESNDPDSTIFQLYDDNSARDINGFITPEGLRYIKINNKTGQIVELDPSQVTSHKTSSVPYTRVDYAEEAPGYYKISFGDEKNTVIYRNPYDGNDVWFYQDGMTQPHQLTPEEIQELINNGVLSQNPQFQGESTGYIQRGNGVSMYSLPKLRQNGVEFNRQSRNIIKHQGGGVFDSPSQSNNKTITSNARVGDPTKSMPIKDIPDLTNEDIAEIASIGLDVASVMMPSVAGGVTGAAASLTKFGTDISRNGLDWNDIKNLGLNLGIDAISFIPVAGMPAKLAKVSKGIKGIARLANPLFLALGMTRASGALSNIVKGEGTIEDYKNFAMGCIALKTAWKEGRFIAKTDYKGKKVHASKSKTASDLKKEDLDKWISTPENQKHTKYEGNIVEWWDDANKKITDYDKAFEGLKDIYKPSANYINKARELKSSVVTNLSNTYNNSLNPFSDNYRFAVSNRVPKNQKGGIIKKYGLGDVVAIKPVTVNGTYQGHSTSLFPGSISLDSSAINIPKTTGTEDNYIKLIQDLYRQMEDIKSAQEIVGSKENNNDDSTKHGSTKRQFGQFVDPILGLIDFGVSANAINQSIKKEKDAVRKMQLASQKRMPTELYPIFKDTITPQAEDQISEIRKFKSTTSDPNQALIERRMKEEQVSDIESKRNQALSEAINQFDNDILNRKQQFANLREQTAYENKVNWANAEAQLDKLDALKKQQNAENVKRYIYEQRQKWAQDLELGKEADLYESNQIAANNFDLAISKYRQDYEADPKNKEKYNTLENYVKNKYPNYYNQAQATAYAAVKRSEFNNPLYRKSYLSLLINPPKLKNGGRMNRPLSDQAFLDQQKSFDKAVENIRKDLMKMFLKMLS